MPSPEFQFTPEEVTKVLEAIQADKATRQVFLSMPREDQLLAILGMQTYTNSQIANLWKELLAYRGKREKAEIEHNQHTMDTATKIAQVIQDAMSQKFGRWQKLGDSIMDKVITIVIIAVLYLAFGGRIPMP